MKQTSNINQYLALYVKACLKWLFQI